MGIGLQFTGEKFRKTLGRHITPCSSKDYGGVLQSEDELGLNYLDARNTNEGLLLVNLISSYIMRGSLQAILTGLVLNSAAK